MRYAYYTASTVLLSGIDILQTVRYLICNIAVWLNIAVYVNGPKKQHFELLKDGAKEELYIYVGTHHVFSYSRNHAS